MKNSLPFNKIRADTDFVPMFTRIGFCCKILFRRIMNILVKISLKSYPVLMEIMKI